MALNLISDAEWAFFELAIVALRRLNGRKPESPRLVLRGFLGGWRRRTMALTCLRSSARRHPSIASPDAVRSPGCGS